MTTRSVPAQKRHRPPVPVPPAIEAEVRAFAAELTAAYGRRFRRNARLKHQVAILFVQSLPPQPGRAGRPGLGDVTEAARLLAVLRQSHPKWPAKRIWREIYARCIAGWNAMGTSERRAEAFLLHSRVRWRLYARKRRARQKR
jgi:hypothetical protein